MDRSTKTYLFFAAGRSPTISFNEAVLSWQKEQGYISNSIDLNWMSIAADLEVPYVGSIDMQNKFADGVYELEAPIED